MSISAQNNLSGVAVIGAGVAGLVTALSLQIAGYEVTLFDRSPFPSQNTSAVAGGMLAPMSESDILPSSYVLAGLHGVGLWRSLLGDRHTTCLHESGSLVLAGHNHDAHFEAFATSLAHGPSDWQSMDAKGIAMLEPALAGSHSKGVYLPQEAHLEPEKAMTALFSRFVATGGRFQLGEADPDSLIGTFGRVIDCRGYIPGHEPDLRAIQGEIITLHQPQLCLSRPVRVLGGPSPFYIVPRSGFEFAVGATAIANADETDWRMRVSSALSLLAFATEIVPALKRARIVALNSGFRAAYPHLLPEVRQRQEGRIIQINGLYRHGYLLSPVLALCVVEMLRGETHEFMRLFDGRLNIPAVHFEEGSGNMGRG